jgi:hypothetical protein
LGIFESPFIDGEGPAFTRRFGNVMGFVKNEDTVLDNRCILGVKATIE